MAKVMAQVDQKEFTYEYGKRWNVKMPRWAIGQKVDSLHVGKTDAEITAIVNEALAKAGTEFTPSIRRQCIAYALLRHKRNIATYRAVMTGYTSRRRRQA